MTKSTTSFYQYPPSQKEGMDVHVPCSEYYMESETNINISVVVPLYNEEDNVMEVVGDLAETLTHIKGPFEIILVDDGSTDNTLDITYMMQQKYPCVKVISHEINRGKSAAMMTGFQCCHGEYVILMDGDGQFRAHDIPKMVEKLEEGYDVVNGWGKKEENEPISKVIPSYIYNSICRKWFNLEVRQFNLGFKGFRRETVENIFLKKDEHRYILPLLQNKGHDVTEVPVEYLPRQNGDSKYGVLRIPRGILDMISLKMELTLGERPFRLMGVLSLVFLSLGVLCGLWTVYQAIAGNPYLWSVLLCIVFIVSSINMLFIGYAVEAAKYGHR
ncbi:MAG: glycosyltransferase family 2 protein [Candidatus Methanofastidiosia archaeon]